MSAALFTFTACSKVGDLTDPYADMDQGSEQQEDMEPSISLPDMPKIEPVDEDATMMRPAPTELQAVASEEGVVLTWLPAGNALRYEVRVNGGTWQNNGVAMSFEHTDAPGGTVTSASAVASDMTARPHVDLSIDDLITEDGPEQTYEVRAIYPEGASPPSQPATARRPFSIDTITWERQDTPETGAWKTLESITGMTTTDTTATPEGDLHAYRATITPTLGPSFTTEPDNGARLAAVQVSVGLVHACARLNNGEVACWGQNIAGQLGIGHFEPIEGSSQSYPLQRVDLAEGVKHVSAGTNMSCAITLSDDLYCWGRLSSQLNGIGDYPGDSASPYQMTQDKVLSLPDWFSDFLCYVNTDNAVRCIGKNDQGQLGAEDTVDRIVPAGDVNVGISVGMIAQTAKGSCLLSQTGKQMVCWGNHIGTPIGAMPGDMPPSATELNEQIRSIALGNLYFGCSLGVNHWVRCWGNNLYGQLGIESTDYSMSTGFAPFPGQNVSLTDPNIGGGFRIQKLATGLRNVCVLRETGVVHCWGAGEAGVNGNGKTENIGDEEEPLIPVELGGRALDISVGGDAACAIVKGDVKCWGSNYYGKLGRLELDLSQLIGDEPGEMPPAPVELW